MLMDKELLFKFHNSYLPNAYEYFGPKFITKNNQEYIVFRVICIIRSLKYLVSGFRVG